MTDIVRVLRILEYVGPRADVEYTLKNNAVPSNGQVDMGHLTIRSAIIGEFPEILANKGNQRSDMEYGSCE